jgi:membrane protein
VTPSKTFKFQDLPRLIVATFRAWLADDPFRLSAIVAYYAVISLPALLVIIINTVGAIWGYEIVQGKLTDEFTAALGRDAATSIETIIRETRSSDKNAISTLIGIGTLLFGATGVFYQLKVSINEIWNIVPKPKVKIWKIITDRALSFAFILVIGFLLLISFMITAALSILTDYIREMLPDWLLYVAYTFDFVLSMGLVSFLFALMFKFLPDAKIPWKTVWKGAVLTAFLFVFGEFLLGLYFAQADPGSTYGAAGTIVLILLWVSYSSMILFFGAEFTHVYAKTYGEGIPPSEIAKKANS